MKPFSIAAVQMHISATHSNVELMKTKIDLTMTIYPWVQMIVFSELAGYGPLTHNASTNARSIRRGNAKAGR